MKRVAILLFAILFSANIFAQNTKNLIIMIPDGTSIASLSLARWYKSDKVSAKANLNIDPYICAMVTNHCSNAPTADSAPAMTWYMTGYPSQTGFVSMYPPVDENDIYPLNPQWAYSPRITLLEAARIHKSKSIGLVFTCEFPHATPAATSSHWYSRKGYSTIADQMSHNSIDVVIGGGTSLLSDDNHKHLRASGYDVILDDIAGFRASRSPRLWSLFGKTAMPNDFDRDPEKQPSLSEMTLKAIATLKQNNEGFVLMVEGSKIDWAAHQNDPIGIISEVLAFDEAVKVALEFAQENGETTVVIMPDHGNSGISVGNSNSNNIYDRLPLKDMMSPLVKAQKTAEGLTAELIGKHQDQIALIIKQYWGIEASVAEINSIKKALKPYEKNPSNSDLLDAPTRLVAKVIQSRSYVGFTTTGHTAEDLFLAVYSPSADTPRGLLTATDINRYMARSIGLDSEQLDCLSDYYYSPASKVFQGFEQALDSMEIEPSKWKVTGLRVTNSKNTIRFQANSNMVSVNSISFETKTPAIYVDTTHTWFVSREVLELIKR